MTRRRRRVIALSDADRRRLESGELSRPEDALAKREPSDDVTARPSTSAGRAPGAARPAPHGRPRRDPDDERILADVPPHFGPL
ncbi:MAG: hypothetical protein ACTH0C_03260 [Actinomycetaceae bacterium]